MNQELLYEVEAVMPAALATGLFVSLATFQAPTGDVGPSGAPLNTFADVAGLVNIPCIAAPTSDASVQANELKSLEDVMAAALLHVLLNDWYPQIENGVAVGWRVVIDGIVFDLLGAESDSQGQQTRIEVKVVRL